MKFRHASLSTIALAVAGLSAPVSADTQDQPVAISDWNYDAIYETGGIQAERLIGAEVFGTEGEEIGNVENTLISDSNQIVAIVAEVGGFWDMGDNHIAVPWNEVEVTDDGFRIPVNEDNVDDYDLLESSYVTASLQQTTEVDDELATGANVWRLTDLMGDYATLNDGAGYGTVDNVLFTQGGEIQAVVVDASSAYGYGSYAYPFYGYGTSWTPGATTYDVGYDEDEIADFEVFEYDEYDSMWN